MCLAWNPNKILDDMSLKFLLICGLAHIFFSHLTLVFPCNPFAEGLSTYVRILLVASLFCHLSCIKIESWILTGYLGLAGC